MAKTVTVFMGGDIFASVGLNAVQQKLPLLKQQYAIDFIIWNAENASGGNGLLQEDALPLFNAGVDVLTGGNHIFEKRDAYPFLENDSRVLRPANYPQKTVELFGTWCTSNGYDSACTDGAEDLSCDVNVCADTAQICAEQNKDAQNLQGATCAEQICAQTDANVLSVDAALVPGRGFGVYNKNGVTFAVLNVQGRENLMPLDCPFRTSFNFANLATAQNALLFVDFHAESNEEKEALALFLDGKACAVCGTHTHVQTADERVLPNGTAYITDLGLTGAPHSVIGTKPAFAIKRNLTQVLCKMEHEDNECVIQGALITVDVETKKSLKIERISF